MSMHCHLIYTQIFDIGVYFSCFCLAKEQISCFLGFHLGNVLARSAYTAAYANHTFHEICRKSSNLHQKQRLLTLSSTIALHYVRSNILVHLLEALYYSRGDTAGVCKTLSEYRTLLIGILLRLQLDALCTQRTTVYGIERSSSNGNQNI